jgi:hypothetical protein
MGGLHGKNVAIALVMNGENAAPSRPGEYKATAQRVIDAVVGARGSRFNASLGNPGDAVGAMERVNDLLHCAAPPWLPALRALRANVQAAVERLEDALPAGSLSKFKVARSDALEDQEVAQGKPREMAFSAECPWRSRTLSLRRRRALPCSTVA